MENVISELKRGKQLAENILQKSKELGNPTDEEVFNFMTKIDQYREAINTLNNSKWVDVNLSPSNDGVYILKGIVNQGTPHETKCSFVGWYDKGENSWVDKDGDSISALLISYKKLPNV